MISTLAELKDIYESVKSRMDRVFEPKDDLRRIKDFLNATQEDIKTNLIDKDEEFKTFFFKDFTGGLAKRLFSERSSDDEVREFRGNSVVFEHHLRLTPRIHESCAQIDENNRETRGIER